MAEEESSEAKEIEQKIKEEPYDDDTLKKKIRKIKIYATISIPALFIVFIIITVIRLIIGQNTGNIELVKVTPMFYASTVMSFLICLILAIASILLLKNYAKLSTYNKNGLIIRSLIYLIIIIFAGLFLFSGLFIGDNLSKEYSDVKEYDNVLIPKMQEISRLGTEITGYSDEGVHEYYLGVLDQINKGDYNSSEKMIENLTKSKELYQFSLDNSIKILDDTEFLINNSDDLKEYSTTNAENIVSLNEIIKTNIRFIELRLSMIEDMTAAIEANKDGNKVELDKSIEALNTKLKEEETLMQEKEAYMKEFEKNHPRSVS